MNEHAMMARLRAALHLLAAGMFAGTVLELVAAKHYQGGMQFVPFGLCALGVIAVAVVWRRPDRRAVAIVRGVMLVIAAGSLLGVYEHLTGNHDFVREVRPHADTMTVLKETLQGGAPILAPGVLTLAAAVTIAATYASAIEARLAWLRVRTGGPTPLPAESPRRPERQRGVNAG